MNWKALRDVVCVAALLAPTLALAAGDAVAVADEVGKVLDATVRGGVAPETGALVEQVAVRNRLFNVDGRWEVGVNVGLSIVALLTDHYNLNLSSAYNVRDWFAIELRGGYAVSRHTSLADKIERDFFRALKTKATLNDLTDLWQLTANAAVGARFQPIYGKINVLSEFPVHFQLYAWLGAGVGVLTRSSLVLCADKPDPDSCRPLAGDRYAVVKNQKVAPLASVAIGFRFFLTPRHTVKLEVRDWSYLDAFYVGVKRVEQTTENPTAGGQLSPNPGLTSIAQFDVGYAYVF